MLVSTKATRASRRSTMVDSIVTQSGGFLSGRRFGSGLGDYQPVSISSADPMTVLVAKNALNTAIAKYQADVIAAATDKAMNSARYDFWQTQMPFSYETAAGLVDGPSLFPADIASITQLTSALLNAQMAASASSAPAPVNPLPPASAPAPTARATVQPSVQSTAPGTATTQTISPASSGAYSGPGYAGPDYGVSDISPGGIIPSSVAAQAQAEVSKLPPWALYAGLGLLALVVLR